MSFFQKKMSQNDWAIIMLFGPVTNYLLAPKIFFRASQRLTLISGTACIEAIINPCNMVLVSLFLNVVFTVDIQLNPLSHSEIERTV
jgi:hypothetical protein